MNRIEMISELKNAKLIAHRLGYQMTEYPENSMEVLVDIFGSQDKINSCDGFELDICFTKDSIPVVLHDKYVDDVTLNRGLVSSYTFAELSEMSFEFRKSVYKGSKKFYYKIMSLDQLLSFFKCHIDLMGNKEIKVETKDYMFTSLNSFSYKNYRVLADVLNRYSDLNLTHLSFWHVNLIVLSRIQEKMHYKVIKSDLLCDLTISLFLARFVPSIKAISLRIRNNNYLTTDKNNTRKTNRHILWDNFWMKKSSVISEKNISYLISKFGCVSFYTLNNLDDIEEFSSHVSYDFFKDNVHYMTFTSNDPLYIRKL